MAYKVLIGPATFSGSVTMNSAGTLKGALDVGDGNITNGGDLRLSNTGAISFSGGQALEGTANDIVTLASHGGYKRIVLGSASANTTASGDFKVDGDSVFLGNVSGSSTSTGSFGVIRAGNGNNKFGNTLSDIHHFTGSLSVTGSTAANFYGRLNFRPNVISNSEGAIWIDPSYADASLSSARIYVDSNNQLVFSRAGNDNLFIGTDGSVSGSSTTTGSFGALIVPGVSVVDDIYFGGRTGFGFINASTTKMDIWCNNSTRFKIENYGGLWSLGSESLTGPAMSSTTSSPTAAVFRPRGQANNTGMGGAASEVSLIIAGVEKLKVNSTHISGSTTSTGSFGRLEVNAISASVYQGQIGSRYIHSQTSDSATWTINHNIGSQYPVVTVYDTDDAMMLPETGTATDSDTFTLTFNEAIQGKAVVSVGGIGENAGANYIYTQGSSATNWRVTHSLSQQYPNVTVFDENNQVIIPETVTATDSNHTDIVFSSGQSGYANFSIGSGIPNISAENAGKFLKVKSGGQGVEWVSTTANVSGSMSVSGSITPNADNVFNLGSASKRWANLYTGDIELSNEGTEGNEVDGTTGSWTIQEGEDDLYLLNRKSGKKYKFKLEEIT